ncbi:unnamed protein product [Notodromas monacha]|uniref:V-type proton ATPase subunit a n=1 Tax=Notodromas monacha TaxID=399045 RepID=A0A7R9BGY5_9CRUS|nr:unnamed protein product [Notodromas monacha]CAG0914205.1 unnamed protein product [Notodromas monacha]
MGALFRSEEMSLCQLFLQSEAAYACVSELGELGLVQFRDLNPDVNAFQRKFVNEVRRCDEMERKLRFLEKEIKKDDIPVLDTGENPEAPQPREMIDMEMQIFIDCTFQATFEKLENELKEVNNNAEALKKNYLELTELKHILRKTQVFFDERDTEESSEIRKSLITTDAVGGAPTGQLGFVAGVINRERLPAFERMLWRACRGNVYLKTAEIDSPLEEPSNGDQVYKTVFIIFFQGEQLKTRVKKICEGFRATLYPCPDTPSDRREMAMGVMTRIEDLNTVLRQTQDHRHRVLVAAAKNIRNWFIKVRKIKAIYHTLNLFNLDVTQKCLIAECWVPVADMETIQLALRRGTERSGSTVSPILNMMTTKEAPPTYNRTNKFTQGFQNLIDAYGVSTYREVNPAPYAVITFPFLFAVMFGDIGHGLIMFLAALYMVWKEKPLQAQKIQNEIFTMFFGGRYIILLMGFFSIYTGLMYNDIFSKSLNIFGSSFTAEHIPLNDIKSHEVLQLNPNSTAQQYTNKPYPIGIDPVWQLSANKISFLNSYKMKNSIVLGVAQMLFGVMLSLWNHTYFKRPLNIYCEFIPQILFLLSLFGYLVILVFFKWVWYSADTAGCAPSILITLINMVLMKDNEVPGCPSTVYAGQQQFQQFLVLIAFLCVPWMLLVKPFVLFRQNSARVRARANGVNSTLAAEEGVVATDPHSSGGHGEHGDEEFEFGEVFVHQAIHTIEYALGSISHTASYLRLWALSLAHAQLSEVLWGMVLSLGLQMEGWWGGIILYVLFAFWAVLTVGVLVLMEGLSAFLHTLRLHCLVLPMVEFQSKFYDGNGYAFMPFSFEVILEAARAADE